MGVTPDIASMLTSYAKPMREVKNGVPAYGLSLSPSTAEGSGGLMSHSLALVVGVVAGTILGVRIMRR